MPLIFLDVPEGLTQAYGDLSEQAWQIPCSSGYTLVAFTLCRRNHS